MKSRHLAFAATALSVVGLASEAQAWRGVPIPVVWGSGEKMTEMGELPASASKAVADELGSSVTVAFLYQRAHIFYCDLWTWDGRHVLHSGDKYWEPENEDWQRILGTTPSAKYGKPILYRVPPIPAVLVIIVLFGVLRKRFFKTEEEQLDALMKDSRYQKAIETIFGGGSEEDAAITTLDEGKFMEAKNGLIGEGIPNDKAESNLRKIADTILEETNETIDAHLEHASRLDHDGDWDESAEFYSHVISILPVADERRDYAQNCLELVNQKRSANPSDGSESAE